MARPKAQLARVDRSKGCFHCGEVILKGQPEIMLRFPRWVSFYHFDCYFKSLRERAEEELEAFRVKQEQKRGRVHAQRGRPVVLYLDKQKVKSLRSLRSYYKKRGEMLRVEEITKEIERLRL